jgi:cytochrome c-type biogenesis protein CcmH
MIGFWLIIITMIAIALGFVVWPWIKPSMQEVAQQKKLIKDFYRQRLQELKQDVQDGKLDQQQFTQAEQELEYALLQDLDTNSNVDTDTTFHENAKHSNSDTRLLIMLIMSLPVIAVLIYWYVGSSQKIVAYHKQKQIDKQATAYMQQLKTPQAVLKQLQKTVQQHPADPQGWYLLGRLYMDFRNTKAAVNAFAKANQLKPNQPEIMLTYAQALFVQNHMHLDTKAKLLLRNIVSQDPNNQGVINLLALDSYANGRYQQAIDYWNSLLEYNSPDSSNYQALQAAIKNAQQKLHR